MGVSGLDFDTYDVFTNTVFKGNPLAIVHLPRDKVLSQQEKQSIAREFNYSETVFLHSPAPGTIDEWKIDIFTIDQELPFAGHPTIGTAWALGQMFPELKHGTILAKAGPIPITINRNGEEDCQAVASIPHNVHIHSHKLSVDAVLKLQPTLAAQGYIQNQGSDVVSVVKGMTFALVKLESMEALAKVKLSPTPVMPLLELDPEWSPSFGATYFYVLHQALSRAEKFTISCRMIEAEVGEDPATGSAASALTAFLAMERVRKYPGSSKRVDFELEQGVEMGRDSLIRITVACNEAGTVDELLLSGSAARVMSGQLV